MNKKLLLLALPISLLLCVACATPPKVTTTVIKSYTPLDSLQEVKVLYSTNQDTVVKGEILGEVKVSDAGFTINCDSASVISYIVEKARKMGGNAIYITKHLRPSMASSCHQMLANVLLLDTSSTLPKTALAGSTVEKSDTSKYVSLRNSITPVRKLYRARIALNAGYAWRTADISPDLSDEQKEHIEELTSGIVWDASVDYFFNNLYGISLNYSNYIANANTNMLTTKDLITYIGADFLVREGFGANFILASNIGLGYMNYTSKSTEQNQTATATGSTLGFNFGVDGEYKFSNNWGAGLKLSYLAGLLNQMHFKYPDGSEETINFPQGSAEGLGHFRIMGGIRYYFK